MKKHIYIILSFAIITASAVFSFAENTVPFNGVPANAILQISNLNQSGELIYVGIDFAVFQDEDKDGIFEVKEDKVRRFITNHTHITVDLGSPSDYKKGVVHKLAMRTLYVPAGPEGNGTGEIVIADYNNGKEGWALIPNSEFLPSYFASQDGNPFIKHTDRWELNREQYNTSKIMSGQDAFVRSYDTFWSGEKFILNIKTTEVVPAVRVSIKNTEYTKVLAASEITSSGGIYTGEIWDEEMLNKWGNYIPKELTFTIDAMDGSDVLETFDEKITVNNIDPYFRIKKVY